MTDDDIKRAVSRFLQWKLPSDFSPDGGVSFKASVTTSGPNAYTHWPVGTNLLTAPQAEAMIRHILEGNDT
ncbi:MAG: hypothetical protein ACRCWF_02990 [Beijerinckiaceae bacterium]